MKFLHTVVILVITYFIIGFVTETQAQAPQSFPYQAVARDVNGNLLSNQNVSLRLSILDGSDVGPVVYQETQAMLTNSFGLFTLNIGQGSIQIGTFQAINWGLGSKFIQVEMDATGGNNYVVMGTSQLLSVPYAMYAESANVPGVAGPVGPQGPMGLTGPSGSATIVGSKGRIIKFTDTTSGGDSELYEDAIGNIGLGTTTPIAKLDINGQLRISGGTPGVGKVLMSDVNGLGTWTIYNELDPTAWRKSGNAGTNPTSDFIGTTDNQSLKIKVNNTQVGFLKTDGNIYFGLNAGLSAISASRNVGIGVAALYSNLTGDHQIAIGDSALYNNTFGTSNVGIGFKSLFENTAGSSNTALGYKSLSSNTTGQGSIAFGYNALNANTFGNYNIGIGFNALSTNNSGDNNIAIGRASLFNNTSQDLLLAIGDSALFNNTSGNSNTAMGTKSLYSNTTGHSNTAMGSKSLWSNTVGVYNTAIGVESLFENVIGNYNTALGGRSLQLNYEGSNNVAIGYETLKSNLYGDKNVAIGNSSLYTNATGNENTAVGHATLAWNYGGYGLVAVGMEALLNNVTGYENTALGKKSLRANTGGFRNTSLGCEALLSNGNGTYNTGVGYKSLHVNSDGDYNTAIGYLAGGGGASNFACTFLGNDALNTISTALVNSMALGNGSRVNASNQIRIGNVSVGSIGGFESWSDLSDGRFKKDVTEGVKGLEFITKLRPVTYHLDVRKLNQFLGSNDTLGHDEQSLISKEAVLRSGFIAQEVEATAKAVGYDFNGVDKPQNDQSHYGLRYAEFVVPLVKGMQEQQVQIEKLTKEIEELKALLQKDK